MARCDSLEGRHIVPFCRRKKVIPKICAKQVAKQKDRAVVEESRDAPNNYSGADWAYSFPG